MDHPVLHHPLAGMFRARAGASRRASSWDRSGANQDFVRIESGQTAVLMEHDGPGCVTHVYCAMILPDLRDYRNAILRCFWDGAGDPSVEVPLGDFFGLCHARAREFSSALVAVNAGFGASHGLNAYFPMPFAAARVTLENRGSSALGGPLGAFWYHIDYEVYDAPLPEGVHRFHAGYRQERPTAPVGDKPNVTLHTATNLDASDNYVALDTAGAGRMVGLVLEIDNVRGPVWYGEGDDMVFIDGERWPPSIHGTGTEEIFGGGASPAFEYAGQHTGCHLVESSAYDGLVAMYRWFVHDPIHFARSIQWTVEHGHANNFGNDYASVAYWYQTPLAGLPPLPGAAEMLPPLGEGFEESWQLLVASVGKHFQDGAMDKVFEVCRAGAPFYRGEFRAAIDAVGRL